MQLVPIARAFKIYLEHAPDAKLVLIGTADPRPSASNLDLSRRRAELVRGFLLDMGVPYDKIEIQAMGSEQLLDANTVRELEARNPTAADPKWAEAESATQLAYNRRVDVIILPVALESSKIYPRDAEGAAVLWNPNVESYPSVEEKEFATPTLTGAK
jgi:outer membrane protein OmpA-like peptidoglycan-associated protein